MAERGIMTARGLLRLSIILLQLLLVASICRPEGAAVAALLEQPLVDLPPVGVRIAQPALLAFGLAWVTVIARLVWHPNVIQGGFIWALLATFLALHNSRLAPVPTIYLATAGLILVLSVIETSYTLAYRDELTGLRTRRALSEALLKLGRRYTVAMIDVDHFKAFNDQHGHDAGDQLLRMVASRIANMAGGGRVFRYGGEEFTLILPGKSIQEALPHLETLRRAVEATPFILRDSNRPLKRPRRRRSNDSPKQAVSVTISIGVAERTGEQVDPEEVIKAADQALYRAKKSGRNTLSV
jgi:diguanylate cyclase (GGDEF)-like protein